ncbi:hypothetical protein [Burkholderia gladioli]|uniref:hypothetical protein n=1 Tax=Burkholderia gladioli TaxID=28095 RepID=UPI00163EAB86|nr:hypothetical protein [Burkholderia gladioli]
MKRHVKVADSDAGSKLKPTAVPRPKLSTGSEKSTSQVFRRIEAWERYYLPNGLPGLPPIVQL